MRLTKFLPLAAILLVACVDTTGITGDIHKMPHPKSNAVAAVTVVEYADFQCPACAAAHEKIVKPLLEQYGSKVRFEHRHFPLQSIHQYAMNLAEASECAADQGKFWEFADMAFEHQKELGVGVIRQWAQSLSLDMDLFDRCTKSHIKRDALIAEYDGVKI